jgi:hypothetical protein
MPSCVAEPDDYEWSASSIEQSIPIDNVPCLPAFQLTEQRLCGGHVVSDSLQHCDLLLTSSASVQENCAVELGASARARHGSRRSHPQSGDDFLPMLPKCFPSCF